MNQPYFGLENVIADSKLSNVRSCIILRLEESLTPFNKNDRIYFFGGKSEMQLSRASIFLRIHKKTHTQSLPHSPISRSPVGHFGSLYVPGKLSTYPFPKATFCLK